MKKPTSSRKKSPTIFSIFLTGFVAIFMILLVILLVISFGQQMDNRSQASATRCLNTSASQPACKGKDVGDLVNGGDSYCYAASENGTAYAPCGIKPRSCGTNKYSVSSGAKCLTKCPANRDCRGDSITDPLDDGFECAGSSGSTKYVRVQCCPAGMSVTNQNGNNKCVVTNPANPTATPAAGDPGNGGSGGSGGGTATPPSDQGALIGIADTSVATCSSIMGWAGMSKDLYQTVSIHVYANGPAGSGAGPFIIPANWPTSSFNANRVDMKLVCQAIGGSPSLCGACETNPDLAQCKHRFNVKMADLFLHPAFVGQNLKNGASHPYYLYAVNPATATQPATSKIIGVANLACPN